jgi:hypothetical protein
VAGIELEVCEHKITFRKGGVPVFFRIGFDALTSCRTPGGASRAGIFSKGAARPSYRNPGLEKIFTQSIFSPPKNPLSNHLSLRLNPRYRPPNRRSPALVLTQMDEKPLNPIGRPRNAPRGIDGRYLPEPDKRQKVRVGGNSRLYAIKKLSRDGRYDLVGLVRERKLSARAAMAQARWGKAQTKPPASPAPVKVDVKALVG